MLIFVFDGNCFDQTPASSPPRPPLSNLRHTFFCSACTFLGGRPLGGGAWQYQNAFRVLNANTDTSRPNHEGFGILVSEESRETHAAYTLRNPDEVATFLEMVVKLGEERCCGSWRR